MKQHEINAVKYANADGWGKDHYGFYAPNELRPGDVVSVYLPKTQKFKDWGHHDLKVIAVAVKGVGEQVVTASAPGYGSFRFTWNARSRRGHMPRSRISYSFVSRPD